MLAIKYSKRILDCLLCSKEGDKDNNVSSGASLQGGIIKQESTASGAMDENNTAHKKQGYGPANFSYASTITSAEGETFSSPHTIVFPNAYIGLFLEMPAWDSDGELTYTEVSAPSYHRIPLRTTGVDGKRIMKDAEEITTGSDRGKARIENQQMVVFPECTDNEGWGVIRGFGIWSGINWNGGEVPSGDTGAGELVFWDVVEPAEAGDATITVSKGNVPIIRIGDFQVTLG